jgi:hypothetical protein
MMPTLGGLMLPVRPPLSLRPPLSVRLALLPVRPPRPARAAKRAQGIRFKRARFRCAGSSARFQRGGGLGQQLPGECGGARARGGELAP